MKALGNVFSGISAVFALIPGMAILTTSLGVPPGASKVVFGATIEAVCVLTLLILWVNKKNVKRIALNSINKYAVLAGGAFVALFILYSFLYGYYVEEVPHTASILFPLWPNGELAEGLQTHGSRMNLIEAWGRDDVYKVIQGSSSAAIQVTTMLFLLVYMGIFLTLTIGFGMLGIKAMGNKNVKPTKAA